MSNITACVSGIADILPWVAMVSHPCSSYQTVVPVQPAPVQPAPDQPAPPTLTWPEQVQVNMQEDDQGATFSI